MADSMNLLGDNNKEKIGTKSESKSSQEIRLVMPTFEKGAPERKAEKNVSWWQRRKMKREEKKREKLRQKGETATQEALKKGKAAPAIVPKAKADLFGDLTTQRLHAAQSIREPVAKAQKPAAEPDADFLMGAISFHSPSPAAPQSKPPVEKAVSKPVIEAKPAPVMKKEPVEKSQKKELETKRQEQEPEMKVAKPEKKTVQLHEPEFAGGSLEPNVNLAPEMAELATRGKTWVLAVIVLLLATAVWLIVGGITATRVRKAETAFAEKNAELAQVQTLVRNYESGKNAAQLLQKQFNAVEGLVNAHIKWQPFFTSLEETTIPDVYYVSLNANMDGRVTLRAIAKSYEAAARQIRAFERAPSLAKSVEVHEARVELQPEARLPVPIVAFDVNLTLADGLLFGQ